MHVEVVTIGEELLLGFTIDTNAPHLARELAAIGVRVVRRATVADDAEAIAAAVSEALDRTGAVITTGGLGPTSDDATKPAIARLFGRAMRLNEAVLSEIEERFRRFRIGVMPASNVQQAMIPEGAEIIPNAHGSAPAIWLEDERGRWVAMLPGVPREMRGILQDELLPRLTHRAGGAAAILASRTLRTTGIGESALADRLAADAQAVEGIPLAYLPGWEGADLRLTVNAPAAQAAALLERAAQRLQHVVGEYLYGENDEDLAALVLGRCRAQARTIAVAESCTGGMLGARLTSVPGSSDVFLGGIIAYANAVKEQLLEVPAELIRSQGAVSEDVAGTMAVNVRARLGASIGIAITGIAGPGGGSPDKPVGLVWVAVAMQEAARTVGRVYVGDRDEIRRRATQAALDLTRRMLLSPPSTLPS